MQRRRNRLSLLAAAVSILIMLSGCGGGGSVVDPAPMPPMDDSVIPGTNEIEDVLSGLRSSSKSPALARFGADPPPPDAVTCEALLLGCEGGLGPVHYRAVGEFDFSGFRFIERRRGVSLAERRRVSGGGGDAANYRALAGWMDHSFFLVKTPGIEVVSEENRVSANYYGAYSIGNIIDSNPDVPAGGAATWSGIMVGIRIAEPDGFVKGDATITVSSPQGNPGLRVDVEFRNMKDEQAGVNFDDVSWEGLALRNGSFGVVPLSDGWADSTRHPARRGISGRFYGPNHEEVGGLFSFRAPAAGNGRAGGDIHDVSGAFGARRD